MAPKGEKKPAKKVAKTAKQPGEKKAKRSKAKVESFKIYIYKVLKQVIRGTINGCGYDLRHWRC